MDQEGEEFTGMVGRGYIPLTFGTLPAVLNAATNALNRVPLRTNMASAILFAPLSLGVGVWYAGWMKRRATEEDAMMKHYILTHPQHFPGDAAVRVVDGAAGRRHLRREHRHHVLVAGRRRRASVLAGGRRAAFDAVLDPQAGVL